MTNTMWFRGPSPTSRLPPQRPPQLQYEANTCNLKFVSGNIRVCQSCRGTLRSSSGLLHSPPYDMCVARLGKRQYWISFMNEWCVPSKETNSHYCAGMACIQFSTPTFVSTSLVSCQKNLVLLLLISIQYAAFIHYSVIHYL